MKWNEFFHHKNFDGTDIVFLPDFYCEQYGLLAGDTILVHSPDDPRQGCVLTVGWDDIEDNNLRIFMCRERVDFLQALTLKVRETGQHLTADKLNIKIETDKPKWIIAEMASSPNFNEPQVIEEHIKKEILSFARFKKGVNYNCIYSLKHRFVFSGNSSWGVMNEERLKKTEFIFTENIETWKENDKKYQQLLYKIAVLKTSLKKKDKNFRDLISSTETEFKAADKKIKYSKIAIEGGKISNWLSNGIIDDFEKLKEKLKKSSNDSGKNQFKTSNEGKKLLNNIENFENNITISKEEENSLPDIDTCSLDSSIEKSEDKILDYKDRDFGSELKNLSDQYDVISSKMPEQAYIEEKINSLKEIKNQLEEIKDNYDTMTWELRDEYLDLINNYTSKLDGSLKKDVEKITLENLEKLNKNLGMLQDNLKNDNIWYEPMKFVMELFSKIQTLKKIEPESDLTDIKNKSGQLAQALVTMEDKAEEIIKINNTLSDAETVYGDNW